MAFPSAAVVAVEKISVFWRIPFFFERGDHPANLIIRGMSPLRRTCGVWAPRSTDSGRCISSAL